MCFVYLIGLRVLIFRLLSVTSLVLITGCNQVSVKSESLEAPIAVNKTVEANKKIEPKELKTAIEPDVLYTLLTAEIAGQRGQYDIALEGYLIAARKTKDSKFAERAVMIAMYTKDSGKTSEALGLWLKQDPKNQTARKIATLLAIRSGNKTVALEHLNAMLAFDSDAFESVLLELAAVLEKEEKVSDISEALDFLLVQHPDRAEIYFVQSLLAIQQKNKDIAELKINKAIHLKPEWDKALIFQAQIAIFAGDLNKAKLLLTQAAIKHPNNTKINKMLAQVLLKSEHYKEALDVYHKIVFNNPNDVESQFAEGLVYLQLNQDGQAESIFKRLEGQSEWKYQAYFYLGKIKEKQGHIKTALLQYDQVTEGPFHFDAAISAVSLLQKEGQIDEASIRLAYLQEKFPKQKIRLLLIQAELFSHQKKYDKSFDILTKALAEYPDQKEFLYARALIADHLNKLDIVESDLKKVLAVDPDNAQALNAIGYSLLNKPERYSDAEKYLKKALDLSPNEAVIIDSYGWLQFKLGNVPSALSYLQQAYEKQKENEIAAHITEVLWASGKKDEAERFFNRVFRESPADEYLKAVEKRLFKGTN